MTEKEILKEILKELKLMHKIAEETQNDTNYQLRRIGTRLEEINK